MQSYSVSLLEIMSLAQYPGTQLFNLATSEHHHLLVRMCHVSPLVTRATRYRLLTSVQLLMTALLCDIGVVCPPPFLITRP
jgi:hypothetical protein